MKPRILCTEVGIKDLLAQNKRRLQAMDKSFMSGMISPTSFIEAIDFHHETLIWLSKLTPTSKDSCQ
jgi:hypothetical protein